MHPHALLESWCETRCVSGAFLPYTGPDLGLYSNDKAETGVATLEPEGGV